MKEAMIHIILGFWQFYIHIDFTSLCFGSELSTTSTISLSAMRWRTSLSFQHWVPTKTGANNTVALKSTIFFFKRWKPVLGRRFHLRLSQLWEKEKGKKVSLLKSCASKRYSPIFVTSSRLQANAMYWCLLRPERLSILTLQRRHFVEARVNQ